jgi:hypothetical protein
MGTIQGLKKFLKTTVLDDKLRFGAITKDKIFATLESGAKVYWLINEDLTVKSSWYYLVN